MISQFLLRHQAAIENASVTADLVFIEFKHDISVRQLMTFYADLITDAQPKRATIIDTRKVRLEFR